MKAINGLTVGWSSGQTYFSSLNQTSEGSVRQIIWISLHIEVNQKVAWQMRVEHTCLFFDEVLNWLL